MSLRVAFESLTSKLTNLCLHQPTRIFVRNRNFLVRPKLKTPIWFLRRDEKIRQDYLTQENEEFINEVKHDQFGMPAVIRGVPSYEKAASPLTVEQQPQGKWTKWTTKRCGLIARKIGNYPLWSKDGKLIRTTLLQVSDNHVVKYIPADEINIYPDRRRPLPKRNKTGCLIVGAECVDPTEISPEYAGLFNNTGVMPKRVLARFYVTPNAVIAPGTPLVASHYRVGDFVDVRAQTLDRGFQGVMKRWGFKGMPATHGQTKTHRKPGNIGGGGEKARVWPGTKMPGHMGNKWRILRGCEILRINTKFNVMWVRGVSVAGATNGICYLYDTLLPCRKPETPPPFPTYYPGEEEEEEILHECLHNYKSPSITYAE